VNQTRRSFMIEPPAQSLPAAPAFLRQARFRLREDYLLKIARAVTGLSDEQIWWRPNEASNSIGNLLLHMAGNLRQWLIAGVGGQADVRDRAGEFAARDEVAKDSLLELLQTTIDEADLVLARLEIDSTDAHSDAPLQRICTPQGFEQTVLDAVFHAVEHCSYHTGQIVLLAKWQAAGSVRFYDERQLNLEE
jgi:uncharacterized damage-inducible protein DinB